MKPEEHYGLHVRGTGWTRWKAARAARDEAKERVA